MILLAKATEIKIKIPHIKLKFGCCSFCMATPSMIISLTKATKNKQMESHQIKEFLGSKIKQ